MCHCHYSCRHSITPPDRRFMGLGIPDPWIQHPALVALKSPKIVEKKCEEHRKEKQPSTPPLEPPADTYFCVHHSSGWPPPGGFREAFRKLCSCCGRRKVNKCPHCGCRVRKGEECLICERASNLGHKTRDCTRHRTEQSVKSRDKTKEKRRLCCHCRSKIKKALSNDAETQTDMKFPSEKKLPSVEKEKKIICCKHKRIKSSEKSRICCCCRRRLEKEYSKYLVPPAQVPQAKICVHRCRKERAEETDIRRTPAAITSEKEPRERNKKFCCLCHCALKHAKVKTVQVSTQTETVSRPEKGKLQPSPVKRKKKRNAVNCKHEEKKNDECPDHSKLMNEKRLLETLYRCWNDYTLAVRPSIRRDSSSLSDSSIPSKLDFARNCNSSESLWTLWSKASELLFIPPRGPRPPKTENVAKEKERGIGNKDHISGKTDKMTTKESQTSFDLLLHLVCTKRPEIIRCIAQSAQNDISSSDRTKKNCPYHSE